jgi:arylsulfatase A-like enzyme
MLKNNGYATAAIGKWHLGWDWESIKTEAGKQFEGKIANKPEHYDWSKEIPGGPLDRGFDSYFGDGTINFPPYCWVENNKVTEVPSEMLALGKLETKEGNWEFRPGPMVKDWNPYEVLPTLAKRAVEVVTQQSAEKPFFLYFAFPSPHAPIIPNDEFIGKTQAGGFGDFVYQTDYIIGQVLEALKQKGLDENTIVLFSADNGPERYAFDRIQNYDHSSMGELRGLKRDTWEGGHRIPFIVKWPGFVKAGAVSHEVINQVDIMRTLANIIGAEIPNDAAVDSYNLLPVWKGESYKKPLREATVQNTYEERYALRQGDWLLINSFSGEHSKAPDWYNTNNAYIRYDKDSGEGLLFNLKEDVSQKNNLFEKHPEKVAQMRDLLKKYRNSGRSVAAQ